MPASAFVSTSGEIRITSPADVGRSCFAFVDWLQKICSKQTLTMVKEQFRETDIAKKMWVSC